MLKKGETSLTEAWDANATSSHNHFMLGQITEWFYKDLAGIAPDPDGPGFKKILIQPTPVGDLKWVDAIYESMHGPISAEGDNSCEHDRNGVFAREICRGSEGKWRARRRKQ
jgi:hypothetical protein